MPRYIARGTLAVCAALIGFGIALMFCGAILAPKD